jgi:uncharacterized membrane protein
MEEPLMWRDNRNDLDSDDLAGMALSALGWFVGGAGLMYLLDPRRGARRRTVIRDKTVRAMNDSGTGLRRTGQYLRDSSKGLVAETRARFSREQASDYKVGARVRSAMGRVVSHPSAVWVTVVDGNVTLCGDVPAAEADALVAVAKSTRGVRSVINQLNVHADPAGVPSLQGESRRTGGRWSVMRDSWTPLTRTLVGLTGGVVGIYGAIRRDWIGAGLGLLGLGMATRSVTNLPTSRLVGVGAGHRAVDVQKTININAPLDGVFGFFSRYDNFPRFMRNVREVRDYGTGYSHWTVAGPAGVSFEWDAELTEFIPHECIAWQSVPGSTVDNAGTIRFRENPDGTTRIDIRLSYNPPGGALGHVVAKLFGSDPKSEMDEDLRRLKTALETGNLPRDAAQPVNS